jgi:hypothetical protein
MQSSPKTSRRTIMDATRKYFTMRKPDLQKLRDNPNTSQEEKEKIAAEFKRRANRRQKKKVEKKTY